MRVAALISWFLTASLGAFMLHTWLARGGLRRERTRPGGLPPQLIFGHATLAVCGFLVWAAFVASGVRQVAWVAVGMLLVAITFGLCTVTLWTPYPARRPGERRPAPLGPAELVIPDTAASVEEVLADPTGIEVTDELIARLLTEEPGGLRPGSIRPNPAVLVPIAHGFMAIGTFVLVVTSAIS